MRFAKLTLSAAMALVLGTDATMAQNDCAAGKTLKDGVLTIATGNPAYFPWVIDNDPTSGKGFEAAVAYYPSLDRSGKYPILLPNYEMPDKVSTGMVTSFNLVYPHVFGSSINMTPQIDLLYDIHGTSPNTIPFVEGRLAVTPSLNFEYLNKWRASISYTSFAGGGTNNLMADRDYLAVNFSYSF